MRSPPVSMAFALTGLGKIERNIAGLYDRWYFDFPRISGDVQRGSRTPPELAR